MALMGCCVAERQSSDAEAILSRVVGALSAVANLIKRVQASGVQNNVLARHMLMNSSDPDGDDYLVCEIEVLTYVCNMSQLLTGDYRYGALSTGEGIRLMEAKSTIQQTQRADHCYGGQSQVFHFDTLDAVKVEGTWQCMTILMP
jgi:hypothetical protein